MAEDELRGWLIGRLPKDWFNGAPEIDGDREEIYVVGRLEDPAVDAGANADVVKAARQGRAKQFREETRAQRIRISEEAQRRFSRVISWGVQIGEYREMFTHLGLPVMTRLRLPERRILDQLVDAGVARSRSHALAWCVRLVARNQSDWLKELKEALGQVERVRHQGPLN
ncbi:MAG: hypothetical protein FJ034_05480 [Chloroflexi bacterium]|nr:hypothetical protein [Chloroflexota bacterium]